MNKEEFLNLIDICKLLKSDYVYTIDNLVIGVDRNFVYAKKMELEYILPSICVDMLEITNFIRTIKDNKIIIKDNIIYSNIGNISLFNNEAYKNINKMINNINCILHNNYVFYNNIHDNNILIEVMSLKTSDGLKYMRLDNFMVPLYKGLLPMQKNDKIDLFIYDIDIYKFLVRYIIHKKKNMKIEVFMLCRHMINMVCLT